MRDRRTHQLVFVKFRSIISVVGPIFDMKEEYDAKFMAEQLAVKRPDCGYRKALYELVLQDRHEHAVQFRSVYRIFRTDEKEEKSGGELQPEEERLFCWGFHARHFINDLKESEHIRCKRILAYFSDGTYFHVGSIESTRTKFDPRQRMDFGYACTHFKSVDPIDQLSGLNWEQITSETIELRFQITADNLRIDVKPFEKADQSNQLRVCRFFDLISNEKNGRAFILINDCMDSSSDKRLVEQSISEYIKSVRHEEKLVDLAYLKMQADKEQFDKSKIMVTSLSKRECQYNSLCGAKAASLAQLVRCQTKLASDDSDSSKFEVPNGVVLTRYAYDAILDLNPDLKYEEKRLAAVVSQGKLEDIQKESDLFRKIFSPASLENGATVQLKIPEQLLNELEASMLSTFNMSHIDEPNKSFAVRSSSWGEDEDDMSAAGQLATLLSVQGFKQICEAILICFGSKYSATNLEYKRQHGLPIDMPMAIVIQEMVDCDKAGVMFTCDPASGDQSQLLISANYGLGESVVSAAADPDSIVVKVNVDKMLPNSLSRRKADMSKRQVTIGKKKIIMSSKSIRSKQSMEYGLSVDQPEHGPITQNDLNHHDLSQCCLEDGEILKLAACALKISHCFQCSRDIEWGIKGNRLYLFQTRPITGLDAMNDFELSHELSMGMSAECEWLSRANVGEVMPIPVSPLNITYCFPSWAVIGDGQFMSYGLIKPKDWYPHRGSEMHTVNYFSFFSLRISNFIFFGCGKDRPLAARALEIGLFGHEIDEPQLSKAAGELSMKKKPPSQFYFQLHMIPYRCFASYLVAKIKNRTKHLRRDILKHKFVKTNSTYVGHWGIVDLFNQLAVILPKMSQGLVAHIFATTLSPEYNFKVTNLLSRYIDDPIKLFSCFSKLLAANSNVFSAGVPRTISRMAQEIEKKGVRELESFIAMNDIDALRYIGSHGPKSELTSSFDRFMTEFGHRCYSEFDIRMPRWREHPEEVVNMVRQTCKDRLIKLGSSDKAREHSDQESNAGQRGSQILAKMGIQLSWWDSIHLDYFLLPKCYRMADIRERTKDLIIYNSDCIRSAFLLLAREMRQHAMLPEDDLIFYLTYEELESLVEGPKPGLVTQARRRKRFLKRIETWKFEEIIRGYDFLPRHLAENSPESIMEKERLKDAPQIMGTPASAGKVEGCVCIINDYKELNRVKPGDILVTYSTDIAFSPIFPVIGGIVTEIGGLISHGAVIAREYGIPSLIGITNACQILKDGERVILDATKGHLIRMEK